MKSLPIIAAAAMALSAVAAPAFAQTVFGPSTQWYVPTGLYGNIGYSNLDTANGPGVDLSAITGRLGARFGRYIGVEGELSGGIGSDSNHVDGDTVKSHLQDQYAGYVVGFLPITPQFELLARVGYGAQGYHIKDETLGGVQDYHYDSVNFGGGGQYSFTPRDAVRVDYTRYDAQGQGNPDSNTWNVSYVRKF